MCFGGPPTRWVDRSPDPVYPLRSMRNARTMYADRAVTGLITLPGWLKPTPGGPACARVS